MNHIKTFLFLSALTALLLVIGSFFGRTGLYLAMGFALVMNFGSYWFSDKIVLAMYRAQRLSEEEDPSLFRIVRELTQKAGLPMPAVYRVPTESPNAFATGRNRDHAAVAVTDGIRQLLSDRELRGVLGHELGHVRNHDTLIQTVSATIAGAISAIANIAMWGALLGGFGGGGDDDRGGNPLVLLFLIIVAPLAASLIQLAISRSREYLADESGAKLTDDPQALADALKKLESWSARIPMNAQPATAHLFIVNPLKSGQFLTSLFSTHPPLEERIARLENMAHGK